MNIAERAVLIGVALGLLLFCVLIIAVFATGQTFMQRCKSAGHHSEALTDCITALEEGKEEGE